MAAYGMPKAPNWRALWLVADTLAQWLPDYVRRSLRNPRCCGRSGDWSTPIGSGARILADLSDLTATCQASFMLPDLNHVRCLAWQAGDDTST